MVVQSPPRRRARASRPIYSVCCARASSSPKLPTTALRSVAASPHTSPCSTATGTSSRRCPRSGSSARPTSSASTAGGSSSSPTSSTTRSCSPPRRARPRRARTATRGLARAGERRARAAARGEPRAGALRTQLLKRDTEPRRPPRRVRRRAQRRRQRLADARRRRRAADDAAAAVGAAARARRGGGGDEGGRARRRELSQWRRTAAAAEQRRRRRQSRPLPPLPAASPACSESLRRQLEAEQATQERYIADPASTWRSSRTASCRRTRRSRTTLARSTDRPRPRPEPGAARDEPLAAGEAAADDALVHADVPDGRHRHRPLRLHLLLHRCSSRGAAESCWRGRSTCMMRSGAALWRIRMELYFRANVLVSPEFRAREHLVERRVVRLEVRLDRVVGLALDRAARDEALHRRVRKAHLDAEALE